MLRTTSSSRAALAAAFVLVAAAVPVRSASAQTATLNFNSLTGVDPIPVANNYTESGYTITAVGDLPTDPTSFTTFGTGDIDYTGSPALFLNSATANDVSFARQGGGLFSFNSIDLFQFFAGDNATVSFTGFGPGGFTLHSSPCTVTQIGVANHCFLAGFTGLSSVTMSATDLGGNPYVQFDNVSFAGAAASTVPEPATLGLVATGLIGMAGVVRRRTPRRKTS